MGYYGELANILTGSGMNLLDRAYIKDNKQECRDVNDFLMCVRNLGYMFRDIHGPKVYNEDGDTLNDSEFWKWQALQYLDWLFERS